MKTTSVHTRKDGASKASKIGKRDQRSASFWKQHLSRFEEAENVLMCSLTVDQT
jgi:hypothetical protein